VANLSKMTDNYDPMQVMPGYRMDIVSEPGVIILCRSDGSEVAKFSALGATLDEIERAALEDYHRNIE
jgi:hypothetical protein